MADRTRGKGGDYWLWYVLVSGSVLAGTWAVVTRVLPPRLVPNADFRERAVRFSTEPPAFDLPEGYAISPVMDLPAPGRSAPEETAAPTIGERGRLWRDVGPLLDAGRFGDVLPRLRSYLADHPEDSAVRLELARTLARAGRLEEAEARYRELAAAGDPEGIVGLGHLLWRRDQLRPAAGQFRRALRERPEDEAVRGSLARVLRSMGRHGEAARHYRKLIELSGERAEYRLELARTLLWAGDPWSALAELREAEGEEAAELAARIATGLDLPASDSAMSDPAARARRARAAGDPGKAADLYRLATLLRPGDRGAWLEWVDLLAEDLAAPGRAVSVLEEYGVGRDELPPALRRRLARYSAWAGDEERARRILAELAREGEAEPGDLALLGDLLRWADERGRAGEIYRLALSSPAADSAAAGRAARGLRELAARDHEAVGARDPRRVVVTGSRLDDSDGFARTLLRGAARLGTGSGLGRFVATADWTRLEGARVAGSGTAVGAEVGYVRWLDHATARLEVRAGRERRGPGADGTNRVSAELLLLDRLGDRFGVEISSRPAHEITQSLASFRRGQRASGAGLSLDLAPADATRVSARVRADALNVDGAGKNLRLLGAGTWLRSAAPGLRLGVASRILAYASPALSVGGRPAHWSPELSWTPSAVAEWRLRPGEGGEDGWELHAGLQPGLSLVKEHGADDVTAGSSASALAGALYHRGRVTAEASASWIRSRAGRYDALSATLGVSWRF